MTPDITINKYCRTCKKTNFVKILDFGLMPLANAFLKKRELSSQEKKYPLRVYFCKHCHLVQLKDIVSPKILFKNYVYVSSTSSVFIKHFEDFASHAQKLFSLTTNSLVVDIGSNDGILLKPFQRLGMKVLGIEPARNIARVASKNGIETIIAFFSRLLAKKLANKYGKVDLVTATNVFAHINDLDEVITGTNFMLSDNGIFMLEVPYLVDFLQNNLFDTVYHEHLSYFSLTPLTILFKRFKMNIIRVDRISTHGGSIRVFTARVGSIWKIDKSVPELQQLEKKLKLGNTSLYTNFAKRVSTNKRTLRQLLTHLKQKGERIVGYGAPAKGNTLLNYFKISAKVLDYIVDDSPNKQGLYTPGTHIKVYPPKHLYEDKPDYVLVLAWNFAESIIGYHAQLKNIGVRFIIPVPTPKII